MEYVNLADFRLLLFIAAVMRKVVVSLRDVDKRIRLVTPFICQHKSDDARDIRLKSKDN